MNGFNKRHVLAELKALTEAVGNVRTYEYDPDHGDKPAEGIWYATKRGWSRRRPPEAHQGEDGFNP
ncbi:MAG: hypothetical protein J6Y62_06075 [Clostridia bacterium]|nr:hypothetical protein [Clostridia bacterium]